MTTTALGSLTVFAGSASGADPVFADAVRDVGRALAEEGIRIVYGGGRTGLMGVLADAALQAGGEVEGIIPQSLVEAESAHPGLTRLDVVADLHERKRLMAERGDGFLALPGGVGTLEELFEIWSWQSLGLHAKPVALCDVAGFWQPMLTALDRMAAQGFLRPGVRDRLVVAEDPRDLLAGLRARTEDGIRPIG